MDGGMVIMQVLPPTTGTILVEMEDMFLMEDVLEEYMDEMKEGEKGNTFNIFFEIIKLNEILNISFQIKTVNFIIKILNINS